MRHFRFSLSALLCFFVVVASAFAALASPLGWWSTAFKATTLSCLFFAILAAIYGRQSRQPFWLGFAVIGWSYFALQHIPVVAAEVPTSAVSWKIAELVHRPKVVAGAVKNSEQLVACSQIVRWLWPNVLGCIGGAVALWLRASRDGSPT